MASSRVARGRRTQEVAAQYYRDNGARDAEAVSASLPGRDIRKVPLVAPEVKARRDFNPKAAMKQAVKNAGDDMPVVIVRPDGVGEANVAEWLVIMRFEDHVRQCQEAGYW